MKKKALEKAIRILGSQNALAKRLGVSRQLVAYWLNDSVEGVPAKHVPKIEAATDFQVTKHDLRPDVFT